VKSVKEEPELEPEREERGGDASFVPNDDAVPLNSNVHRSQDRENDGDQLTKITEKDRPQSMGLNSLFDYSSELAGITESERMESPPTTFAALGVNNWFQEPASNFTTNQLTPQWTPDAPSTPQMRIKRKPPPATSNLGQLPLDSSAARPDYAPYQPEGSTSPPRQQNAPSLPPGTPLSQSTSSYNRNSTTPQNQAWTADQNTSKRPNQTGSPLQQRPQYQSPPLDVQPGKSGPYAPFNPQSYPAEQYRVSTPPWGSDPSPQSQGQGQGQSIGYFVENSNNGEVYGGGRRNRYVFQQ